MLTDPAGQMVELSTPNHSTPNHSTPGYQPTKTIWTQVVAEHGSCYRPGCDTPATEAELDHRVAWPQGPTDTENLWPGCKADHKAKHAPGFTIEHTSNGSFVLRTPTGFRHRIERTEHPAAERFETAPLEDPDGFQFSATELLEAISYLRELDADQRPLDLAQMWEIDCEEALTDVLDQIYAVA